MREGLQKVFEQEYNNTKLLSKTHHFLFEVGKQETTTTTTTTTTTKILCNLALQHKNLILYFYPVALQEVATGPTGDKETLYHGALQ